MAELKLRNCPFADLTARQCEYTKEKTAGAIDTL